MIEKILERLEETDFNDIQMVVSETLVKYGFPRESIVQDEIWDALDGLSTNKFAIRIVQEVAKEYVGELVIDSADMTEIEKMAREIKRRKVISVQTDGGWIPCSERMPEKVGYYLTTIKFYHLRKPVVIGCNFENGEWWNIDKGDEVLAWQPLPAPYQKGE